MEIEVRYAKTFVLLCGICSEKLELDHQENAGLHSFIYLKPCECKSLEWLKEGQNER